MKARWIDWFRKAERYPTVEDKNRLAESRAFWSGAISSSTVRDCVDGGGIRAWARGFTTAFADGFEFDIDEICEALRQAAAERKVTDRPAE